LQLISYANFYFSFNLLCANDTHTISVTRRESYIKGVVGTRYILEVPISDSEMVEVLFNHAIFRQKTPSRLCSFCGN
jgi:hypothetical protein